MPKALRPGDKARAGGEANQDPAKRADPVVVDGQLEE